MRLQRRSGLALALLLAASGCAQAPTRKAREGAEIHFQLGAEALQANRREDALREFGEALSQDDVARILSDLLGRPIRARAKTLDEARWEAAAAGFPSERIDVP